MGKTLTIETIKFTHTQNLKKLTRHTFWQLYFNFRGLNHSFTSEFTLNKKEAENSPGRQYNHFRGMFATGIASQCAGKTDDAANNCLGETVSFYMRVRARGIYGQIVAVMIAASDATVGRENGVITCPARP